MCACEMLDVVSSEQSSEATVYLYHVVGPVRGQCVVDSV